MAVSSIGAKDVGNSASREERGRNTERRTAMAREGRDAVAEALVHQAVPGGVRDEEYLSDGANFARFVRGEVKGIFPEKARLYLRSPAVVLRWAGVLRSIERDVEAQLGRLTHEGDLGWRGAAEKFLRQVRRRLAETEHIAGSTAGGDCDQSRPRGHAFDLLTAVRRYLVDEAALPEAERARRRERAIRALSEVMGETIDEGRR